MQHEATPSYCETACRPPGGRRTPRSAHPGRHPEGGRVLVVEAQDADEAFELLKTRPEINAVLTDVDMPGSMDGFEFARLVRQGWPEVGVLVISGKTGPGPGDLPPNATFLHKPIMPDNLIAALQDVMAKRPQNSGAS